jgi:ribonuclease J
LVSRVVNELEKLGATVVDNKMADVHVSGHACQEELKLILGLVKPKFFMPVHGEFHHLSAHAQLAMEAGMEEDHILLGENGNILEINEKGAKFIGSTQAGAVMVDGSGVGDVGSIVLRDRRILSQEGIIMAVAAVNRTTKELAGKPEIITRGFIYVKENEDLMEQARFVVESALKKSIAKYGTDFPALKTDMRDALNSFIQSRTKRAPMIIPVIMDI